MRRIHVKSLSALAVLLFVDAATRVESRQNPPPAQAPPARGGRGQGAGAAEATTT